MRTVLLLALVLLSATAPIPRPSQYVFAWATEINARTKHVGQDFLGVYSAAPNSPDFGKLLAFLPVGRTGSFTHHTNNDLPLNGRLFAEDFESGRWFVFDLRDPLHPRLVADHSNEGPFAHPHSFEQLPSGDTLATFQYIGENKAAGGLVELDPNGKLVRMTPSAGAGVRDYIRPYSMEVVPKLDRIVTSSSDMSYTAPHSHSIQIWRLSDLKLIKTIALPKPQLDGDDVARDTSEPRLLSDGTTVLVPTFYCGLYELDNLGSTNPSLRFVYDLGGRICGVATVMGKYWIGTMESAHAVQSYDVSDPLHPVLKGRVTFAGDARPHWIAKEPDGDRLVVTGYASMRSSIWFLSLNPETGSLSLLPQHIDLNGPWPDGWTGEAVPHSALLSNS